MIQGLLNVAVFILAVVIDWLYVRWAQAATGGRAGRAFATSGLIQICGVTSTILYVTNPWLTIPNVMGHAVGSYIAVKYDRSK